MTGIAQIVLSRQVLQNADVEFPSKRALLDCEPAGFMIGFLVTSTASNDTMKDLNSRLDVPDVRARIAVDVDKLIFREQRTGGVGPLGSLSEVSRLL